MDFTHAYEMFIDFHLKRGTASRSIRLRDGLGATQRLFLEQVWWPVFHQFDDLYPQYKVPDFKSEYRYIDFAYILPKFRVAMEVVGYETHWKNLTDDDLSDSNRRHNELVIAGWHVLRFPYEDILERPARYRAIVERLKGQFSGYPSETM